MEKQQILMIHGGNSFDTPEEYISYLKDSVLDIDRLRPRKDWKDTLQENLGDSYDVFLPKMPNATNAQYEEWKIMFEKIMRILDNELIFIGHSLGGVFLAKYLSENILNKKIRGLFLIAPPFNEAEMKESMASFALPAALGKMESQAGKIFIYQSKDDKVVPFSNGEKYKEQLPNAVFKAFEDRGHFNQEGFPEIIEDIKSL